MIEDAKSKQRAPVPCRLQAIFAKNAPVGVIFRRGPSRWVQVIKWYTDTDTFEPGAWFSSRIYEDRCDISPDGTLLVYLAMQWSNPEFGVWTAISRPPWLTALALWPRNDLSFGGGFFKNDHLLVLYEGRSKPAKGAVPKGLKVVFDWQNRANHQRHIGLEQRADRRYYKRSPLSDWMIIRSLWGRVYQMRNEATGMEFVLDGVRWADWDQRERLVYAKDGKLFAGEFDEKEELQVRELANFNGNKPERTRRLKAAREERVEIRE